MDNFDLLEAAVEACKQQNNSKVVEPIKKIEPIQVACIVKCATSDLYGEGDSGDIKSASVIQQCIHSIIISNGNKFVKNVD